MPSHSDITIHRVGKVAFWRLLEGVPKMIIFILTVLKKADQWQCIDITKGINDMRFKWQLLKLSIWFHIWKHTREKTTKPTSQLYSRTIQ